MLFLVLFSYPSLEFQLEGLFFQEAFPDPHLLGPGDSAVCLIVPL